MVISKCSSGLFIPYSGHIKDTKSVEFASVAVSFSFFHKNDSTNIVIINSTSSMINKGGQNGSH